MSSSGVIERCHRAASEATYEQAPPSFFTEWSGQLSHLHVPGEQVHDASAWQLVGGSAAGAIGVSSGGAEGDGVSGAGGSDGVFDEGRACTG